MKPISSLLIGHPQGVPLLIILSGKIFFAPTYHLAMPNLNKCISLSSAIKGDYIPFASPVPTGNTAATIFLDDFHNLASIRFKSDCFLTIRSKRSLASARR